MSHRYFYIQVMTPMGMAANYVRTEHHPLHPEEEAKIQRKLAGLASRRVAMMTHQVGHEFDPGTFVIIAATELELAVAQARWSEDFGLPPPPGQVRYVPDEVEVTPSGGLIMKP